jgi:hypothetical protein
MPHFTVDRDLPSCRVNVELLRKIQLYAETIFPTQSILIDIAEPAGVETLATIAEYRYEYLPSSARSVRIRSSAIGHPGENIELSFGLQNAGLKIYTDGIEAREKAIRIRDEVFRMLEPYQTLNHFLHGDKAIGWLMVAVTGIIVAIVMATAGHRADGQTTVSVAALVVPLAIVLAFASVSKLKPYSMFDTRENKTRNTIGNWILLAVAASVIGVIVKLMLSAAGLPVK